MNDRKLFVLADALKGDPVIGRRGHKVTHVFHIPDAPESKRVLVIWEDWTISFRHEDGKFFQDEDSEGDLFMAPKKVRHEAWLNLNTYGAVAVYSSKEGADDYASKDRVECRHITWEVEV